MFFANASKLFSFFFSEKNDEDPILADFLKKMATAWDGCTAAQQIFVKFKILIKFHELL